jgi:hypothetical protein
MGIEQSLVLKSVLINKTQKEYEEITEILENDINWIEVGGFFLNHRLAGYFFLGLSEEQLSKIPKEMREVLKLIVKAQKEQQEKWISELLTIANELMNSDIKFAALKGIFFGCEMYELGSRRSNDMDLLVYEEDLERLDKCLRQVVIFNHMVQEVRLLKHQKRKNLYKE